MTDPTGRSFLSYRRSRSDECERLVAAQWERGIPTWRDVDDMNSEPTESELRRIIRDGSTANVVLWITPETAGSPMIRNVEAPVALERHDNNDGFFIIPVAAGGLGYAGAAAAIKNNTSITDLGNWNVVKLDSDPATDADISRVANQVLKQRLQAIDRHLLPDAPFRIALNTRQSVGHQLGQALTIDWSHRFGGIQSREATPADWHEKLLPALADVSRAIQQNIPERRLLAGGCCHCQRQLRSASTLWRLPEWTSPGSNECLMGASRPGVERPVGKIPDLQLSRRPAQWMQRT